MKVSELAAELEVPASTVLAQCQRFSIDASWVGAELSAADVVVLRAELAGSDELDLTGVGAPDQDAADAPAATEPDAEPEPEPEPEPDAAEPEPEPEAPASLAEPPPAAVPSTPPAPAAGAGTAGGALPPTAVGSMPELIDEVTPPPTPDPAEPVGGRPGGPLQTFHGAAEGPSGEVRRPDRLVAPTRRIDRGIPGAIIALLLAIGVFAASNLSTTPVVIFLVWLSSLILVVVAFFTANRARHRCAVHPDRYVGQWGAIGVMALTVVALIGLANVVYTVVRDQPADTAPFSLGKLSAVQDGRWGYQQFMLVKHNHWDRPSKIEGSCWLGLTLAKGQEPRQPERHEVGVKGVACSNRHTVEIGDVFTMVRDADAPYPGVDAMVATATRRCAALLERASKKDAGVVLRIEYPTEHGWHEGDHELGCALLTGDRTSSLLH